MVKHGRDIYENPAHLGDLLAETNNRVEDLLI